MREIHTVTEAINHLGMGRSQWFLLAYTGLAWSADACETMLLSFLGPSIKCSWPDNVGSFQESMLTSVVFVGMLFGVYTLGAISDAYGRKKGFFISASVLGIAGVFSSMAPSFKWLLIARTIVGAALGGTPIAVTLFTEWAPPARRGSLVLLLQSAWTLGTIFEACIAWIILPTYGWRWLLAISALPMLLLLLAYPWIPETPYWLMGKNRCADAESALQSMAKWNGIEHPLPLKLERRRGDPNDNEDSFNMSMYTQTGASNGIDNNNDDIDNNNDMGLLLGQKIKKDSQHHREDTPGSNNNNNENEGHPVPSPPLDSRFSIYRHLNAFTNAIHTLHTSTKKSFSSIFSDQLSRTTTLLWIIWFVNAITYYGLVLLTTLLQTTSNNTTTPTNNNTDNNTDNMTNRNFNANPPALINNNNYNSLYEGEYAMTPPLHNTTTLYAQQQQQCTADGKPNLTSHNYAAILITSLAEAPGILIAALLIDRKGRIWCLRAGLMLCALCLFGLLFVPGQTTSSPLFPYSDGYEKEESNMHNNTNWPQLALLFIARACIEGTFSVLYIYTPELYETRVRSFGLALCNGFSRFGGFSAPFVTVWLVEKGHTSIATTILAGLCCIAACAAMLLRYETLGRDLEDDHIEFFDDDDDDDDIHAERSRGDCIAVGSVAHISPRANSSSASMSYTHRGVDIGR